jgi:hypothetical protein
MAQGSLLNLCYVLMAHIAQLEQVLDNDCLDECLSSELGS